MEHPLILKTMRIFIAYVIFLISCFNNPLLSQPLDRPTVSFSLWMETCGLNKYFRTIDSNRFDTFAQLNLRPVFLINNCDSLSQLWAELSKYFSEDGKQVGSLHDVLLDNWSFINELPVQNVRIVIKCNETSDDHLVVFGESDGAIRWVDNTSRAHGDAKIFINKDDLTWHRTGIKDSIPNSRLLSEVLHSINETVLDLYKGRSKQIHRSITIDTSRSFFYDYGWEFMNIKKLAIPDKNYFEYHKIRVELTDVGEHLYVRLDFKGKYASGILVSPNLEDYNFMEDKDYADEMIEFERVLFNHIENTIRK